MILAFYSYKGGVGRTSLALDTAARLAMGGEDRPPLRVLVWDLDLDAPGVRHFPAVHPVAQQARFGTRDLLALLKPDPDATDDQMVISEDEVLAVLQGAIVADERLANGRLAFMLPTGRETRPLGEDDADPTSLFGPGAPGPSLLALAADLARRVLGFEVIVVDARTGVNDLAATATTVLADCAVLVFRLDGQDVAHLSEIVDAIQDAWNSAGAATTDIPNRLYRVANLVPSGGRTVREAVDARRQELVDLRLEPHLELPLRPLALVRESTPRLEAGAGEVLDQETDLALEDFADWVYERTHDFIQRDPDQLPRSAEQGSPPVSVAAGKRLHEEVAAILRLGGWRIASGREEAHEPFDIRATKTGEFKRTRVLLVQCKKTRRAATAVDVERLSLAAKALPGEEGAQHEVMMVAQRFSLNAATMAATHDVLLVSPEELIDELAPAAPLRQYARELWEGTALERQYVSPTAVVLDVEGTRTTDTAPLDEHALAWLRRDKPGLLCVLGDFGAGKTTFCLRLAASLAREQPDVAPVPLYVDLRAATGAAPSLDALMRLALDGARAGQSRLDAWRHRLRRGSLVLLVDGFDELLGYLDPAQIESLLEEIQQAATIGPVILTSRSSYFRSDHDTARVFRDHRLSPDKRGGTAWWKQLQHHSDVTVVEIQPFGDLQLNAYLTHRFGESRVEDILKQMEVLKPVDDLLRRPYLLALVATSIGRWETQGWPERLTLTSVYESYVDHWLTPDSSEKESLPAEPANLAQHLARVLWNRPGAKIDSRGLRSEVASWSATVTNRWISDKEQEAIEQKIRTALFLVRDERGDYRFAHQSLLEFFVAKGLSESLGRRLGLDDARFALDISPLTPEIAAFLEDWPARWSMVPEMCLPVLEAPPTLPCASANALLLLVRHSRSRGEIPVIANAQLEKLDLRRMDLSRVELPGANLSSVNLSGADLSGAGLGNADLTGANATRVNLSDADLRGTCVQSAMLAEANLEGAWLSGADLHWCNLRGASLVGADLSNCHLAGAILSQADLREVTVRGANLTQARLVGARADGVDLQSACLEEVDLRFASLRGAVMPTSVTNAIRTARIQPTRQEILGASVGHVALTQPKAVCAVPLRGSVRIAVGCGDGAVRLWEPESGKLEVVHCVHKCAVQALCTIEFDDCHLIASGAEDGTIAVWDVETRNLAMSFSDGTKPISALCQVEFADGTPGLAGANGSSIQIWNLDRSKVQMTLGGHDDDVLALCQVSLPGGRVGLASAGNDLAIRIWDLGDEEQVATLLGHEDWIRALCPVRLPGGGSGLASAGDDQVIRIWDLSDEEQIAILLGHEDWIRALCPVRLPGGGSGLASAGDDQVIRIWDLSDEEQVVSLSGPDAWILELCSVSLPGGLTGLVSVDDDEVIRLWELETGEPLTSVSGKTAQVNALCAATFGDRRKGLATVNNDGALRIWDVEQGELVKVLIGQGVPMSVACSLTLDGSTAVATGNDRVIRIWDTERGELVKSLIHPPGPIRALCEVWLGDGSVGLASAGEGGICIWDVHRAEQVRAFGEKRVISMLCPVRLAHGKYGLVGVGHDGTMLICPTDEDEKKETLFEAHDEPITAICALPAIGDAANMFASADRQGMVHLWSQAASSPILSFDRERAQAETLCGLSLDDGSPAIASAGRDGAVCVWSVERQEICAVFEEHLGPVISLCALTLRDGTSAIASAGRDGTVRLHHVSTNKTVVLVAVEPGNLWLAYRSDGVVGDGEPAAWGTEEALDRLLLAGDRWSALDVQLTFEETVRVLDPLDLTFPKL